jgi:hypothetical protein
MTGPFFTVRMKKMGAKASPNSWLEMNVSAHRSIGCMGCSYRYFVGCRYFVH